MQGEEFEEVFERVVGMSREVLVEKAREYASDKDRLHNFRRAAAFQGCTPEQALWGMNTKHLVSISDAIEQDTFKSPEYMDEKIGDAINYLILLQALLTERFSELQDQKADIRQNFPARTLPDVQLPHN